MNLLKTRQTCRICGGPLTAVLDLGEHHLAGYEGFGGRDPIRRKVPLELCRCDSSVNENGCGLVQLKHTTPGSLMYPRYFYRSGINSTMTNHLHDIVDGIFGFFERKGMSLSEDDTVVDVGCNDGTSLKYWKDKGIKNIFGFDPAKNMHDFSKESGAEIIIDYFTSKNFNLHIDSKAKVITSIAMFYDLEDPKSFVKDISDCLEYNGVWVFEQSYLPSMLKQNAFDTICHEHIEYYSLSTIQYLLSMFDLEIIDVYLNDTNGGSFQLYASHKGNHAIDDDSLERIQTLIDGEFELGLDGDEPFMEFRERVDKIRNDLIEFLNKAKSEGKKVYAYGASTKGAITLQSCGITNDLVPACADRNPMKWGTTILGTNIPIISEDEARAGAPDYFLVLPWHFMSEFKSREKEFLSRGGKFVVPMPNFMIIEGDE
tara:strand:+ start:470 stop:1756 length:1287 start_codon:yes stop_codon:yes gene_type:complete